MFLINIELWNTIDRWEHAVSYFFLIPRQKIHLMSKIGYQDKIRHQQKYDSKASRHIKFHMHFWPKEKMERQGEYFEEKK